MAYTIFEVNTTNASIGGPSSADNQTSLSTSNTDRLQAAYPGGPQHTDQNNAPAIGDSKLTYNRAGYRELYEQEVMGGNNGLYEGKSLGGTKHSRNYSDNGPPNLKSLSPTDEPAQGSPLSTVLPHGLGPNVNTQAAQALLGWSLITPPGEVATDPSAQSDPTFNAPSSLPFVGDGTASPSSTSERLSKSSLHLQPPGKSKATPGS